MGIPGWFNGSHRSRQRSTKRLRPAAALKVEALETRTLLSFLPAAQFAVGQTPVDAAIADFNNDHHPDLVVANHGSNALSLFLSNADASWQPATNLNVGSGQNGVAVADFNGDGNKDLVVAKVNGGLSILLGNGNGTFQNPTTLTVGAQPAWVVVGDFNGDGHGDIAVADSSSNSVSVLMGNGNGTFQTPTTYGVDAGPVYLRIADLTHSGKVDLVTANSAGNDVSVLINNGNGTFKSAANLATDAGPTKVTAGDFNGDGNKDLAVATSNGTVTLLFGNGDGTFKNATNLTVGTGKTTVAIGDFNSDGRLDLATASQGSNTVNVLLSNGDGSFKAAVNATVGNGIGQLRGIDANHDGKSDLVSVNSSTNTISVLQTTPSYLVTGAGFEGNSEVKVFNAANGTPRFDFHAFDPTFRGGVRVAVGDVNGDGVPDIVVAGGVSDAPLVHVYDGMSGNVLPGPIGSFMAYDPNYRGGVYVATGNFDGDNKADIVVGADAGGGPHVKVFSGADGHVIDSFYAFSPFFVGGVRVAVGDVNGDGHDDIIAAAGPGGGPHVKVFDGTNIGHILQSFYAYSPLFSGGVFVAAGDFNFDGKADIVTGAGAGGGPHVKIFSGADASVLASFYAYNPYFLGGVRVGVISDITHDGHPEVVTGAASGGGPHVKVFGDAAMHSLDSFYAYDPAFLGGVFVGGK